MSPALSCQCPRGLQIQRRNLAQSNSRASTYYTGDRGQSEIPQRVKRACVGGGKDAGDLQPLPVPLQQRATNAFGTRYVLPGTGGWRRAVRGQQARNKRI